jgi:hypothetical protein
MFGCLFSRVGLGAGTVMLKEPFPQSFPGDACAPKLSIEAVNQP